MGMILLIAASDHGRRLGGVLGWLDCCLMLCSSLVSLRQAFEICFCGITSFDKELIMSQLIYFFTRRHDSR